MALGGTRVDKGRETPAYSYELRRHSHFISKLPNQNQDSRQKDERNQNGGRVLNQPGLHEPDTGTKSNIQDRNQQDAEGGRKHLQSSWNSIHRPNSCLKHIWGTNNFCKSTGTLSGLGSFTQRRLGCGKCLRSTFCPPSSPPAFGHGWKCVKNILKHQ